MAGPGRSDSMAGQPCPSVKAHAPSRLLPSLNPPWFYGDHDRGSAVSQSKPTHEAIGGGEERLEERRRARRLQRGRPGRCRRLPPTALQATSLFAHSFALSRSTSPARGKPSGCRDRQRRSQVARSRPDRSSATAGESRSGDQMPQIRAELRFQPRRCPSPPPPPPLPAALPPPLSASFLCCPCSAPMPPQKTPEPAAAGGAATLEAICERAGAFEFGAAPELRELLRRGAPPVPPGAPISPPAPSMLC